MTQPSVQWSETEKLTTISIRVTQTKKQTVDRRVEPLCLCLFASLYSSVVSPLRPITTQQVRHYWQNMSAACQWSMSGRSVTQSDVRYSLISLLSDLVTSCHRHHPYCSYLERDDGGNTAHHTYVLFSQHVPLFTSRPLYSAFISAACLTQCRGGKQYSPYSQHRFPQGGFALLLFLLSRSIMHETWLYKWYSTKSGLVAVRFNYRCFISSRRPAFTNVILISQE